MPDGGEVSEAAWRGFVDEVLTPNFPDGLTEIDARGQFAAGHRVLHEASKLVLIVAASTAGSGRASSG